MLVSYPILALAWRGSVKEATLLVGVVHLPRGHRWVQEVSFQRFIVQARPPTWAVKNQTHNRIVSYTKEPFYTESLKCQDCTIKLPPSIISGVLWLI